MTFFLIVITITIIVYFYIGIRVIIPSRFNSQGKLLLWIIHLFLFFMPIMTFILRIFNVCPTWRDPFSWVAYISLGFFSLLFAFLVILDCIKLIINIINKIRNHWMSAEKLLEKLQEDGMPYSRRKFLTNTLNTGFITFSGAMTIGGIVEARDLPEIERVKIPINGLPEAFHSFKIAQISDIHIGPTIKGDFLQSVVKRVNSIKPDIVAITGDLVDGRVSELKQDVAPLRDLKSRYGTFFITGNHEYYSGVTAWLKEIKSLGINVLVNEHQVIKRGSDQLVLAGVTDRSAGQFIREHKSSPGKALKGAPSTRVKLLLAHQPRTAIRAEKHGYSLVISGHTHGGQYFPWNFFVRLAQPFVKGLNRYKDMWIYVNRGTGYWGPPVRLGVPSEITEISLIPGPGPV